MKNNALLLTCTAALALGLAGCSRNESGTTTADDANKAASSAATSAAESAEAAKVQAAEADEAAKVEAAEAADAAKVEAARVAEAAQVAAAAEAATAANNAKVQGLIDKANSLVAESRFSDASGVLQQLTGLSLTSEQQKVVDGLMEQIQEALASKATESAVGTAGDLLR